MNAATTALSATPFASHIGHSHVLCDKGPAVNCLRVRVSARGMSGHPEPGADFGIAFFNWKNGPMHLQPFGAPILSMTWDSAQTMEGRAAILRETEIHERDLDAVLRWNEPSLLWHRENASGGLRVLLSNGGNPDHGQDPDLPLPHTFSGTLVPVESLWHASALCRSYIQAYGLGIDHWSGGEVVNDDGEPIARVSFNGRVFTPDTSRSDLIIEAAPPFDFPPMDSEDLFVLHRDLKAIQSTSQTRRPDRPRN